MLATVHVDPQHHVGPVDRRIFGGFLEHLGRAVYGGVYDPGNNLSEELGFRRDVLTALKRMGLSVIRYPGGNFVSAYDWQDGIGPKESRPRRPDYAWRSVETNQFGTDEFMAWCRRLGAEPMLAVNLGTAGMAEAAQLVEYCNLPGGTSWSDRRRHNGATEPYGVRYWCLGNEMDGPWQAGQLPPEDYALKAHHANGLMKGIDRSIQTIVCGSSGRGMSTYMHWDRVVLEKCFAGVEFISAHRYSENWRGDSDWFLAEGVEIDRTLQDYAGLIDFVRGLHKSDKRIHVCFDEWNVWYKDRGGDGKWRVAPHLCEEVYNLEDALVCAQYLSAFIRRADLVKIACIAQIVNVISPIHTRPNGLLLQTTYYPFVLYSQHARGVSLRPVIDSPTYRAGERGDVPALDAAVTYQPLDDGSGTLAAFLVNRGLRSELMVELGLAGARVERIDGVDLMGGGDVKLANTWEKPLAVIPRPGQAELTDAGNLRVTLPAPGLAVVRARTAR